MIITSWAFILLAIVFVVLGDNCLGFVLLFVAWLLAICKDSISEGKGW